MVNYIMLSVVGLIWVFMAMITIGISESELIKQTVPESEIDHMWISFLMLGAVLLIGIVFAYIG